MVLNSAYKTPANFIDLPTWRQNLGPYEYGDGRPQGPFRAQIAFGPPNFAALQWFWPDASVALPGRENSHGRKSRCRDRCLGGAGQGGREIRRGAGRTRRWCGSRSFTSRGEL